MRYLLILTACLSFVSFAHAAEEEKEAVRITTKPASSLLFYPTNNAPAIAESDNNAKLSAQITAQISSIPVKVGQSVKKGTTLARLDCRDYEWRFAQAKAAKEFAVKQWERGETLGDTGGLSQELRNQRGLEKDNAVAEYKLAETSVSRCRIRAPFSGVVTDRLASEGEMAAAGTPIIQLVDNSRVTLTVDLPSKTASHLSSAQRLWFESNGQLYPVKLDYLAKAINSINRNRKASLSFTKNTPIPGSAGTLYWESDVLHLPADIIVKRGKQYGVMVADNDKAKFITLNNAKEGQPAAAAIDDNTAIIINGRFGLNEGDSITE